MEAKYIKIYLKKLFKEWYFYVGVLPAVSGNIAAYFPNVNLVLPNGLVYLLFVICFMAANYNIWLTEITGKELIQKDLAELKTNPVDYEISFHTEKLNPYDNSDIESNIDYAIKKIEEKKRTGYDKFLLENMRYNLGLVNNIDDTSVESWEDYRTQLEQWKIKAETYIENTKNAREVNFYIKNTGHIYDCKISIHLSIIGNAVFMERSKSRILTIVSKIDKPQLPNMPLASFQKEMERNMSYLSHVATVVSPEQAERYYANYHVGQKELSIDLKELRVDEEVNLFGEEVYVDFDGESVDIECIIRSEKTIKPIKKAFTLKKDS